MKKSKSHRTKVAFKNKIDKQNPHSHLKVSSKYPQKYLSQKKSSEKFSPSAVNSKLNISKGFKQRHKKKQEFTGSKNVSTSLLNKLKRMKIEKVAKIGKFSKIRSVKHLESSNSKKLSRTDSSTILKPSNSKQEKEHKAYQLVAQPKRKMVNFISKGYGSKLKSKKKRGSTPLKKQFSYHVPSTHNYSSNVKNESAVLPPKQARAKYSSTNKKPVKKSNNRFTDAKSQLSRITSRSNNSVQPSKQSSKINLRNIRKKHGPSIPSYSSYINKSRVSRNNKSRMRKLNTSPLNNSSQLNNSNSKMSFNTDMTDFKSRSNQSYVNSNSKKMNESRSKVSHLSILSHEKSRQHRTKLRQLNFSQNGRGSNKDISPNTSVLSYKGFRTKYISQNIQKRRVGKMRSQLNIHPDGKSKLEQSSGLGVDVDGLVERNHYNSVEQKSKLKSGVNDAGKRFKFPQMSSQNDMRELHHELNIEGGQNRHDLGPGYGEKKDNSTKNQKKQQQLSYHFESPNPFPKPNVSPVSPETDESVPKGNPTRPKNNAESNSSSQRNFSKVKTNFGQAQVNQDEVSNLKILGNELMRENQSLRRTLKAALELLELSNLSGQVSHFPQTILF